MLNGNFYLTYCIYNTCGEFNMFVHLIYVAIAIFRITLWLHNNSAHSIDS